MRSASPRTKVFVSYSHKDKRWLDDLRTVLAPLEDQLDLWDDRRLTAGTRWRAQIEVALAEAKAALLLVSIDFLASSFIAENEVPPLLAKAAAEGVPLLCVYVRPALAGRREYTFRDANTGEQQTARLPEFQALNDPTRALSTLPRPKREEELVAIAARLLAIVEAAPIAGSPADATLASATGPGAGLPESPQAPLTDPRSYLEWLRGRNYWSDVRGIGARTAERVKLQRVYTRLRVASASADPHAPRHRGNNEPDGATADLQPRGSGLSRLLSRHANVVLVGDPGAGKTTFLRFVAFNLAQALLNEDRPVYLARLGLDGQPPFPIFVRLADLYHFLVAGAREAYPNGCAEQFRTYLDSLSLALPASVSPGLLRERLQAGGCLLLLDGLDEVPDELARARVGAILAAVVAEGRAVGNRHVVTCRTRAYKGRAQLGPEFTRAVLVDIGRPEVEQFVREWSRAVFRVAPGKAGGVEGAPAAKHEHALLAAIRAHPHVQSLTANPLLLTILAVVHGSRKKLPEQRADLYEAALDYLLESRSEQSRHESKLRRECLMAVARAMFESDEGVRKTLGRAEAAEAVAPLLGFKSAREAMPFIEDEELHSGILVSRMEGEVEFWYPAFGEYLAAEAFGGEPHYWTLLQVHVFDARWSEVVLLLARCLRLQGLRAASDFIRQILATGSDVAGRARAVGLVGRILRDLRPYGGDPARGTPYAETLREVISIFEKGDLDVAESVRVDVGEALGQAGDPRISDDEHANRVFIKGGAFLIGADNEEAFDREQPVHRVIVSNFWIDRHPVTVQQFRRFVDAGAEGYLDPQFWRSEGWRWRAHAKVVSPREWEEQLCHPNRPVTRVSWFEADAYGAWLSLTTRRRVELPTEAQWEYAARGQTGRKYPWGGDNPTDQHMNSDSHVGHPTPVGIYPMGATPEGVQDLAGNVWEWCGDWYGSYLTKEEKDPAGPPKGSGRVLRGGAFGFDARLCRAACRYFGPPEFGNDLVGFRCVVTDVRGQPD